MMNHLLLTQDVLNISDINDLVAADSCGAISFFVGTTRDNFEKKKVISLEYEAYEPMALKQMTAICEELRSLWKDIVNIAIYHRLGFVPVREASVIIAVSSPHRKTSLDAVALAIEELKKRVPIWKKEKYDGDESSWKENKESNGSCLKTISFDEHICDVEDPCRVPTQFVQISAAEDEISRRIQCFVEKKREEIDLNNILDFTNIKRKRCHFDENGTSAETTPDFEKLNDDDDSSTCARINSIVVKQEYSKGHLKVRRAENNIGPQVRPDYLNTLDKLMIPEEKKNFVLRIEENSKLDNKSYYTNGHTAFFERLGNIEEHLNMPHKRIKTIYQRLKAIEVRILYLESISPEYSHFLFEKPHTKDKNAFQEPSKVIKPSLSGLPYDRKMYSVGEIDAIIQHMEGSEADFSGGNDE